MVGTVTGENCFIYLTAHSGGAIDTSLIGTAGTHTLFGMGEFSLTFDRGTIEQDLIGQAGNYFDQGTLSIDGSMMLSRFGASANAPILENVIETSDTFKNKYLTISGGISTETDATYLKWFLVSCQVTGYDISMGDADTITEASIDFVLLDPQNIEYGSGIISDKVS